MASKIVSPCVRSMRHPIWLSLVYQSYSNSYAANASNSTESATEFASTIRLLKNRLQLERLVHVLDSSSDLNLARNIFKWASSQKRFYHTAKMYAHMISKLGLDANYHNIDELLREIVKSDIPELEQKLEQLVHFFCENNQFDEALLVIQHASSAKRKLTISVCNVVLRAFVSERRSFQSFMLAYKEVVKAGILPDVETVNCLIEVLCHSGRLEIALDQFYRMSKKKCTPNSQTFEILISALCSSDRVDESCKILDQMSEQGCIPDHSFYLRVIPLFCKLNKFVEVAKLYQMMKQAGHNLDQYSYSTLIQFLCDNQLVDDSVKIFKEMIMSRLVPMTSVYVDIVDSYCASGKFYEAMSFLEENNVIEIEPYNVLLRGLCKMGRLQDAVGYLKKFDEKYLIDCCSWNVIINQFCNEGRIRRACELIGKMIVSSFTPDEGTFSAVISGYCQAGLYENALYMFRVASISNLSLNSESFSELVECLCQMKRIQEASEVFNYHSKRGCSLTSKSLDILIQGSCLAGNVREAIRMRSLAVCAGTSCTFTTYDTIIHGLLYLNEDKGILPLFAQMLVEGYILDEYTYNVLLRHFCTESTIYEATLLFNKMVHDDFMPDLETLESLVPNMATFSVLNKVAHSLSKAMNIDGLLNPRICNLVIYGLIKEGLKSEACNFLDRMLEKGWVPDPQTHGILVGSFDKEESKEARDISLTTDDDKVSNILLEGLN